MSFLATGSVVGGDHGEITMSVPYVTERGDLRATITNNSKKEIQIYPSQCGVEVNIGEKTETIAAKDPQFVSLISLQIPSGEARDFSFKLIPGLFDLEGRLRLFVQAVSTDPLEATTVKSGLFEISDLEASTEQKPGANTGRQATASPSPAP